MATLLTGFVLVSREDGEPWHNILIFSMFSLRARCVSTAEATYG